jgi:hypothetical protein
MDVASVSEDFKMAAFAWGAMPQTRNPHQGHNYGSTVCQVNG